MHFIVYFPINLDEKSISALDAEISRLTKNKLKFEQQMHHFLEKMNSDQYKFRVPTEVRHHFKKEGKERGKNWNCFSIHKKKKEYIFHFVVVVAFVSVM